MIEPKPHLKEITRTPPDSFNRTKYLRLDKNEDPAGLPETFIKTVFAGITPDNIASYPQVGLLYEKLSHYLSLPSDYILIANGSDAAIKNIFEVYIDPGDEIILPDPTYAMYEVYARLFQAKIQKVEYDANLSIDIDDIITKISDRTKLIAIANPNSPTGTIISQDEIERLVRCAGDRDILVLIDEAYYLFYPDTAIELIRKYPNAVVIRTFSKAFGLASLRLGYAVAQPEIIRHLNTFRPIYEANGLAIAFGCAALDNLSMVLPRVEAIVRGREYLCQEMARLGLKTFPSYTNFVHIEVGEHRARIIADYLFKAGILVKTGYSHPTLRQCIRVTTGPIDMMKVLVNKMEECLSSCPD